MRENNDWEEVETLVLFLFSLPGGERALNSPNCSTKPYNQFYFLLAFCWAE